MIKIVCWNIAKGKDPWDWLSKMAEDGEADVAVLQEAGVAPEDLKESAEHNHKLSTNPLKFDRFPLIVTLSKTVTVETFKQKPPISDLYCDEIGVSDIGTIAAAKIYPVGQPDKHFIAVSMYARWLTSHQLAPGNWSVSVNSAHRIISDLAALIGNTKDDPASHRILAAGDLNMIYGACGTTLSVPKWERTVWDRMYAMGLEFMGPQHPDGRKPEKGIIPSDVCSDTKNVPTYYKKKNGKGPKDAANQLDYVFASNGFHDQVSTKALNEISEWGPSDHCRLKIEVSID